VFNWPQAGIGNRLRAHPAEVSKLTAFRLATDKIIQSNLQILTVSPNLLTVAVALCQQIGLLINECPDRGRDVGERPDKPGQQ
jgi:hypothetical protein